MRMPDPGRGRHGLAKKPEKKDTRLHTIADRSPAGLLVSVLPAGRAPHPCGQELRDEAFAASRALGACVVENDAAID